MSQSPSSRNPALLPALLLALGVAGALTLVFLSDGTPPRTGGTAAPAGRPGVVQLGDLDDDARAALWLEVHEPAAVRKALRENAWLQQVMKEPLGQGFAGSWAAFLGSRGEDLAAEFQGTVLDFALDRLLDKPFRMIWFSGATASRTPVIVLDGSDAAAFWAFDKAVSKQTLAANGCPAKRAAAAPENAEAPPAPKAEAEQILISRWTVAEHSVFAARRGERTALAAHPAAVLQGLCTELPALSKPEGTDVELAIAAEPMGRDVQELFALVGAGETARFGFAVQGTQLVPRGIRAALPRAGRLEAAPVGEDLLKLIPEDVPVVATLQLKLPARLEADAVRAHLQAGQGGATVNRSVALVWQPRGQQGPPELALIWSRPEDADALQSIFGLLPTGRSAVPRLTQRVICGKPVLATQPAMADRIEAACAGKAPSILHAAAPVAAGLKARTSVLVGVNLGRLLGRLTLEGYRSGASGPDKDKVPPEIQAAIKRLEELPFLGLQGTASGNALVPGGFKS